MHSFIELLVWTSLAAIAASYILYPVSLLALTRFCRRSEPEPAPLPSVTLVISAFNEAGIIREKIENTLALDYPPAKLSVMVISDGSDDGTDEIVAEYTEEGVILCRQEPRQGKSAGLTRFVPQASGEIIVFSDANSIYEPGALKKLVRHFANPQVGFAVGYQRYWDDASATYQSESLYWRYETAIKAWEGALGSVVCGDGAIYAIRAELFEPLRPDDINDFYLPLRIVAKGFRGVFDTAAVCYERTAESFAGEFRRKARIVNRSLRAVFRVPETLNPFHVGIFAVQLFLHKVLRWFVPFFLLLVLIGTIYLAWLGHLIYQGLLLAQLACYGLAALYSIPWLRRFRAVYIPFYFCMVNAASAVGVLSFFSGRSISMWSPERRNRRAIETPCINTNPHAYKQFHNVLATRIKQASETNP